MWIGQLPRPESQETPHRVRCCGPEAVGHACVNESHRVRRTSLPLKMPPKKQIASLRQQSIASFFGVPAGAKRAAETEERGTSQSKAPKTGAEVDAARQGRRGRMDVDVELERWPAAGAARAAAVSGSHGPCAERPAPAAATAGGAARTPPTPESPSKTSNESGRPERALAEAAAERTTAAECPAVDLRVTNTTPASPAPTNRDATSGDAAVHNADQGAPCPQSDEPIRADAEEDNSALLPASDFEESGEEDGADAQRCAFTARKSPM